MSRQAPAIILCLFSGLQLRNPNTTHTPNCCSFFPARRGRCETCDCRNPESLLLHARTAWPDPLAAAKLKGAVALRVPLSLRTSSHHYSQNHAHLPSPAQLPRNLSRTYNHRHRASSFIQRLSMSGTLFSSPPTQPHQLYNTRFQSSKSGPPTDHLIVVSDHVQCLPRISSRATQVAAENEKPTMTISAMNACLHLPQIPRMSRHKICLRSTDP